MSGENVLSTDSPRMTFSATEWLLLREEPVTQETRQAKKKKHDHKITQTGFLSGQVVSQRVNPRSKIHVRQEKETRTQYH